MTILRKTYRGLRKIASDAKRRNDFTRARANLCGSAELAESEKVLLRDVSLNVTSSDTMYVPGEAENYLTAGLSASGCIQESLRSVGKRISNGAILDFPCGYGRVLRFLRKMFPDSEITGGELETAALDFCEREFSIRPFPSKGDFKSLSLPRKFDLIWCGSLLTHVDERVAGDVLGFFHRHLAPGGMCIFTTHGKRVADLMERKELTFGLTDEGQTTILRDYRTNGYGYADYPGCPDYGISITSPTRAVELARGLGAWEQVHFVENGWHNIQNVHAFALR